MDHLLITKVEGGALPKGEPVAKAPQATPERLCAPWDVERSERVEMDEVVEGDFVRSQGWSRLRRVERVETTGDGSVLFLLDPDESRTNEHGIRRLDREGWDNRGAWIRHPNLRLLWDAAHR